MYCTRTKNPNCRNQFTVKQLLGGVLKNICSKICWQNPWAKSAKNYSQQHYLRGILLQVFSKVFNHRFTWLRLRTPIFQNNYFVRTPSVTACYALKINEYLLQDQSLPQQLSKHFHTGLFLCIGKTFIIQTLILFTTSAKVSSSLKLYLLVFPMFVNFFK